MSIHKSRGLEFGAVITLGVEKETYWGELAKERSVYFVGVSCVKRQLFLVD